MSRAERPRKLTWLNAYAAVRLRAREAATTAPATMMELRMLRPKGWRWKTAT